MNDQRKTRAELILEIKQLRKEVAALKEQRLSGKDKSYLATLNLLEDLQNEIHERKKIEAALKKSDSRFRSFIQLSLDSVYCYEFPQPIPVKASLKKQIEMLHNGILVECNEACAVTYGFKKIKDILGRKLSENLKITNGSMNQFFRQFIKNNYQSVNYERIEIRPDGSRGYYLNNAYGVIENNKMLRIWGIYKDITDQKLIELALQQSEKRYRDLVELLPQTIFEMDKDGRLTYINTYGIKAFGYTKSDVKRGLHLSQMLSPDELQQAFRHMQLMLKGRGKTGNEYRARKKDGTTIYVRVYNVPYYEEGKHTGWRGAVLDITRQIQARKQIQESEELYRELFEAESDALFLIENNTNRILQANKAASKLYGYSHKDLLTMKYMRLLAESDKSQHKTPKNKKNVFNIPFQKHKKKNGRIFIVEITGRYFEWKNQSVRITAVHDITKRIQAEETLRHEHGLLQSITETNPIGIVQVDARGKITFSNKRAEKILQLKTAKSRQQSYNDPGWHITDFHGRPFPEEKLPFNQVRKTGKSVFDIRHAIQGPDGQRHMLSINASPVFNSAGQFESMVASIEDVTEKMQADAKRIEHQKRYEQLFNTMLDGYALHEIICNTQGKPVDYRFLDINPAFENITSLNRNQVIGKTVLEIMPHTESYWIKTYGKVALTGRPVQFENYSSELDKYFQVTAFRPRKGRFACIFMDITQQKKAEQALRQNEAQLSIASKIAKLGYWEYNFAEKLFTFNDPFYAIFRTSVDKVGTYKMPPEQYARQFLHPEDRHIIEREMKIALGTKNRRFSQTLEHRILYADGEIGYISVHYFVVKDKKGRTIKTYGANQDITKRKRAEEALRESERRMRNVLENIKMAAVSLDTKGNILFVNDFLLDLTGYQKKEVAGKNWFKLFIPEELQKKLHDDVFEKTLINNNFPPYHENEILTRKKNRRLIAWNNSVLHSPDGKIIGTTSIGVDITEQRQAADNLKKQNVFIQTILDKLPIGIAVNKISNGKTTYINPKFEEIYGWPAEYMQSVRDFFNHVFPDLKYREITITRVTEDIQSGDPEKMVWDDIEATGRDGTKHIIYAKNIPLPNQDVMISTAQDITVQKQAERERQRHREELQQLSKQLIHTQEEERRKLSRELHDEMGQALTGIKLNVATLKKLCSDKITPRIEERLNETDQLAEDLLTQLHDISLDLRPSMLDDLGLFPTLKWLINKLNKRQASTINLTIQNINERLPSEYETALYRVIQECLNNIAKHAQARNISIKLNKTKSHRLKLKIKDDGRGFDVWELEDRNPTDRGIGIIGMQERINLLKGEIRIESNPGEGTIVTVDLPLRKKAAYLIPRGNNH